MRVVPSLCWGFGIAVWPKSTCLADKSSECVKNCSAMVHGAEGAARRHVQSCEQAKGKWTAEKGVVQQSYITFYNEMV